MKINYNFILIIFIAVIIFMVPLIIEVPGSIIYKVSAAEKYNNLHEEYEDMYQNISMKEIYESKQNNLIKNTNEINLNNEILQEQIINILNSTAKKNNIEFESIVFSEIMPAFQDEENLAECMKVKVSFNSNFSDMLSFIDTVKNFSGEISFFSISILIVSDSQVNVCAELMFYALANEVKL